MFAYIKMNSVIIIQCSKLYLFPRKKINGHVENLKKEKMKTTFSLHFIEELLENKEWHKVPMG